MSSAILLMLLTGALWALVGVLFGAAPAEKDRLWSFFSLNGILFTAFVWLPQAPAAAPPREVPIRTIYLDGNAASHYRPLRDTFRTQLALWGTLFRRKRQL